MVILNFILAAVNFGMMVLLLCTGGRLWWLSLITGCYCLAWGIYGMVIDHMEKSLIDKYELEKVTEKMADDIIEKMSKKK